jgi:murein DD-endopeptidase MepM/ murein hydrolase activator NlpD
MKKKLAIYWLILRSLAADCVKNARDAAAAKVTKTSKKYDVKIEGMRLLLMGRYRASRVEKKTRVQVSSMGVVAVAVFVTLSVIASAQAFSVSVNGQLVGYVHDKSEYASLVNNAKDKLSRENGNSEIFIQEAGIELRPVIKPGLDSAVAADAPQAAASEGAGQSASEKASSPEIAGHGNAPAGSAAGSSGTAQEVNTELEDALIDAVLRGDAVKATVYNIEIDGQPMATLGTMKEASDVLQNIAAAYAVDGADITAGFVNDVQIIGKTIDLDSVRTESAASVTEFLLTGINNTTTYTTKAKDRIGSVLSALNITEDELRFAYPEYDFLLIQEGDVFEYTENIPYIQYETSGVEDVDVIVPYETIEERTNRLYLGEREVKIAGEDGLRHVKRDVTRVNGVITSSEEISSETIKQSSPATVLTGTLLVPGDAGVSGETGGGPLGRPLASWFFSRGLGGAHMGDDMLAAQGTPIMSAEHGVVSFTGVYGGYGNLIKVNHGNGLETYYAHCDTINVETGQTVERGQQIGTVGITGRATAYHLHFEVRVNGAPQEPLDWIS